MGYNYSLKIIPELTSLPVKVIASLNYHGWIVLVLSAEHLQTSNKNCWSFPGLTKAFHVKNAPWECQAVAQVTFHSPQQLLKVVGKTMFVKWKIKGNMATLYFHSHVANHDGASYINGIKSYWELEAWNMTKTHGKTIAGFLGFFCCLLRAWIFFFFPWTQVAKLPMKVTSEITQDNGNEPETNSEKIIPLSKVTSCILPGKGQFSWFFLIRDALKRLYLCGSMIYLIEWKYKSFTSLIALCSNMSWIDEKNQHSNLYPIYYSHHRTALNTLHFPSSTPNKRATHFYLYKSTFGPENYTCDALLLKVQHLKIITASSSEIP